MEFLERGRFEFMELENKRLCIKEEKIQLAKRKEEMERMKAKKRGEGNIERGEINYDNECRYIASSATRIFSSTPIGNPCKEKNW
jgi:hypothetical protein